jgi:DNA-binding transcriptional regulator LsrR (DeoR family)
MEPEDLNSEDFERLARIAHRYYVDRRTQEEIGSEFGLSFF